jgi:hypothetical protein
MISKLLAAATALLIVSATPGVRAQATVDSWIGTWTLNLEKSTYGASPAPKRGTSRLETTADGRLRMIQDQVREQGRSYVDFTGAFDGREYPVAALPGVTYALTRVNEFVYVIVAKSSGVVTSTTLTVVSPDRMTRTSTTVSVNAQGRTVANIAVYDRGP